MKGSSYMSRFSKEKQAKKFKMDELKEKKRKEKQKKLADKKRKQKEKEERLKDKDLERQKKKDEMNKPWEGKDKPGQTQPEQAHTTADLEGPSNLNKNQPIQTFEIDPNELPSGTDHLADQNAASDSLSPGLGLGFNQLMPGKRTGSSYLDVLGRRSTNPNKETALKNPVTEPFLEILEEEEEELEKVAEEPVQVLKKLIINDLEIIRMGETQVIQNEEDERGKREAERLAKQKAVAEKLETERREKERLKKELRELKETRERERRELREKEERERIEREKQKLEEKEREKERERQREKEKEKKIIQQAVIVKTITKTIIINKVGSQKKIIKQEQQIETNERNHTTTRTTKIQNDLPEETENQAVRPTPIAAKLNVTKAKTKHLLKNEKPQHKKIKKLRSLKPPKSHPKPQIPLPTQIELQPQAIPAPQPDWKQKKLIPKFKRKRDPSPKIEKSQTDLQTKKTETENPKSKKRKRMPQNMKDYKAMIRKSKIINRKRRSGNKDFILRNKKKLTQNFQEIRDSKDNSQKIERKKQKKKKASEKAYHSHRPNSRSSKTDRGFTTQQRKSETVVSQKRTPKSDKSKKNRAKRGIKNQTHQPYRENLSGGKKSVESFLSDLKREWEVEETQRQENEKWWQEEEEEAPRTRNISELKVMAQPIIQEEEDEYLPTEEDEEDERTNEDLYKTDNFLWRKNQEEPDPQLQPNNLKRKSSSKQRLSKSQIPQSESKPTIKSKNSYYRRAMKKNLVKDFQNMKKKTIQEQKRHADEEKDKKYLEQYYQTPHIGAERIDKEWEERHEAKQRDEELRELEAKRIAREEREQEIQRERAELEQKEREKKARKKKKKKERIAREKKEREETERLLKQAQEQREQEEIEAEERRQKEKDQKRQSERKKYLNSFLNNKKDGGGKSEDRVIDIGDMGLFDGKEDSKLPKSDHPKPINIESLIHDFKETKSQTKMQEPKEEEPPQPKEPEPEPKFLELMEKELENLQTQLHQKQVLPSEQSLPQDQGENIPLQPIQRTEKLAEPQERRTFHKKMNLKRVEMSDREESEENRMMQENEDSQEQPNKEVEHEHEIEEKEEFIEEMEQQLFNMIMEDNTQEIEQQKFAEIESFLHDKEKSFISQASEKTPKKRKKQRNKNDKRNLIKRTKQPEKSENKGILERFEEPTTARRNPRNFLKKKSQRLKLKAKKVSRVERVMKRNLWELGDTLKRKGFINYDTEYNQIRDDPSPPRRKSETQWAKGKKDFVEGNKDVRLARKGFGGIRKREKFIIGKGLKDFALGKKESDREWRTDHKQTRDRSANRSRIEELEAERGAPTQPNEGLKQLDKKILEGLKKKKEHKEKARERKRLDKKKKTKKDRMQAELERMYRSSFQVKQREQKEISEDEDQPEDSLQVQMEAHDSEPGTQETETDLGSRTEQNKLRPPEQEEEEDKNESSNDPQPKINFLERNKQRLEELKIKKEQEKKEKEKKPKKIDLWSKIKEDMKRELERKERERAERGETSEDEQAYTLEEEKKKQNYRGRDGQEIRSKISQRWKGGPQSKEGEPEERQEAESNATDQAANSNRGRSLQRKPHRFVDRDFSSTINTKSSSRRFIKSSSRRKFMSSARSHSRNNLITRNNAGSRKNLGLQSSHRSRRFIDNNEKDVKVVMIEEIRKTGEGLDPEKVQRMLELAEVEGAKTPQGIGWQDNFTRKIEKPKKQIVVKSMKYSRSLLKTMMEENREMDMVQTSARLAKVRSEKHFLQENRFQENQNIETQIQEPLETGDREEHSQEQEINSTHREEEKKIHTNEPSQELENEQQNPIENTSVNMDHPHNISENEDQENILNQIKDSIHQEFLKHSNEQLIDDQSQTTNLEVNETDSKTEDEFENSKSAEDRSDPEETQDQVEKDSEHDDSASNPETEDASEDAEPIPAEPESPQEPVILGVIFLDEEFCFYGEWDLQEQIKVLTPSELQIETEQYERLEAEERALSEDNKSTITISVKGADKFVQRHIKHRKKASKRLDYYPQGGVFVLAKKKREKPVTEEPKETEKEKEKEKVVVKKREKKKLYLPKNRQPRTAKDRKSFSRNDNKSAKRSNKQSRKTPRSPRPTPSKTNPLAKPEPQIQVSKTPALLKFKSRRKKNAQTNAPSHSDVNASSSFISDFEPNQHFQTSNPQHTQKISQLEVDLTQALAQANRPRKKSFTNLSEDRGCESEGEDFPSTEHFLKDNRLSQTLQFDQGPGLDESAFQKKSESKVSNRKVKRRKKYDPSAAFSKKKMKKRFKKKSSKSSQIKDELKKQKKKQKEKELGEMKLVPKIKIESVEQKDSDIRKELRQNNKKLLINEKPSFADPKTKSLIQQIEKSRKSIPHPKITKNLKPLVKIDKLEEPRIRHGNFIPHGKDKKTLLQNLEQVRNSKPIISAEIDDLRRKIKQHGQLSIDLEGSHAADLLETIRKLSGEPATHQNFNNQVSSFKNFEMIEKTLKSSSREETLLEIINSHQKSRGIKTPMKSHLSNISSEIKKHQQKPSELDAKNQSFVDQIIKSTFDVDTIEGKMLKNKIQSFQTGAQPENKSLEISNKTPTKANFAQKVETGIEPKRKSENNKQSSSGTDVTSHKDSANLLQEPGINVTENAQNSQHLETQALLKPKHSTPTQNLPSSARNLRNWTSEAQINIRKLIPSQEPKKSLRMIGKSGESDNKINFRSLARASKTGISSLKMIKNIISHSKEPNKSRSRKRFDIQDKLESDSKFKGDSNSEPKQSDPKPNPSELKNGEKKQNKKSTNSRKKRKQIKNSGSLAQGVSKNPKSGMSRSLTYRAPFQPFRPGETIDISELSRSHALAKTQPKSRKEDTKTQNSKTQRSSRSNRDKEQLGKSLGPMPPGQGKQTRASKKKGVKRFKPKSKRGKYDSSIGFGSKRAKKK